ncbi:cytochrome c biogenesis CcdA family protein [Actinoplanes auranticolor]|uniref:Cytochrome C biogenesis protein CcdA n=1 Tax=Actinoplanes auranticolor TaxID=47988 RepID=A0A919SD42_9ACTN|nr:cytochrome c biogenesis protein CcdA [Actinoplanes auranticolor]GIM69424.1 cytochrome C biogenesis protein CcdA [Actinoplanes auranticolor]
MGETFADVASSGPLLLAIGAAAIAGLVSFLSPCVLPLMPGYLSYVTGLAGADLDAALGVPPKPQPESPPQPGGSVAVATEPQVRTAGRGRVLAGTVLFVVGFSVVFMLLATLVANIGLALKTHERTLNIVLGVLIIVLGLMFIGLVPGLQGQARISWLPNAGLAGAPVLGALFGLSWLPCTGPTLGAVLGLATTSGQTDRAVVLALAYSLGLGVPFVLFGLFFRRLLGVFKAVRRNSRWVTRIGGVLLVLVGLALVTGGWNSFLIWLVTTFNYDAGTLL